MHFVRPVGAIVLPVKAESPHFFFDQRLHKHKRPLALRTESMLARQYGHQCAEPCWTFSLSLARLLSGNLARGRDVCASRRANTTYLPADLAREVQE